MKYISPTEEQMTTRNSSNARVILSLLHLFLGVCILIAVNMVSDIASPWRGIISFVVAVSPAVWPALYFYNQHKKETGSGGSSRR